MPDRYIGLAIRQVFHRIGHIDLEIDVGVLVHEITKMRHQQMQRKTKRNGQADIAFESQVLTG